MTRAEEREAFERLLEWQRHQHYTRNGMGPYPGQGCAHCEAFCRERGTHERSVFPDTSDVNERRYTN